MYVDVISSPRHLSFAYQYSYNNSHLLLTQFADDTCLLSNSVKSCQILCKISEQFFHWIRIQLSVRKCRALAISSRRAVKVYYPELQIQSETIPFIGDTIFKFLGLPVDLSLSLGVQN